MTISSIIGAAGKLVPRIAQSGQATAGIAETAIRELPKKLPPLDFFGASTRNGAIEKLTSLGFG